ncbi:BTAD domain-containing putative transcriptional regulator [Kitasatospora sp. NPDC001309]|uniref:AfsR/SARP family transcriptional regulator n=1 Tax=Kitasatospora sp. NPDC001309 TaxID=3364013 RepID=UPI0036A3051C
MVQDECAPTRLRFSLLGPIGIEADGRAVPAGPPQQRAVLAALLLRAGRPVTLHELVDALWGAEPPSSAVMVLRTYAWRIRQRLAGPDGGGRDGGGTSTGVTGPDGGAPVAQLLSSVGDGYRLSVPPESVDVHRAERLAATAARAWRKGRRKECATLLTEALSLWQGEPLAGVPGPLAEAERSRLAELRLTLTEQRFAAELARGRHHALVSDLTAFVQQHPLREQSYGFLMQSLYAAGRQADALAVFARARRTLGEELGIDPGPELCGLHGRILAGDPDLLAPAPAAVLTPAPEGVVRPAQLPPDISDFSGRTEAVRQLAEGLTGADRSVLGVASISGMGGIGKSTLAVRVAHQVRDHYPDGQFYADLRGTSGEPADAAAVLGSFLGALGVAAADLPRGVEDRSRLLRSLLDGRRVLLLLDDARDLAQLRPLLPGSGDCAVIVTGRTRVPGLSSRAHLDLDVFAVDEALDLLRQVIGGPRVAAEPAAADEVVGLCGRLPLAVRIVAARLAARPHWALDRLVTALTDERHRLDQLRVGGLAVTTVFELGYRQLNGVQAYAFRTLAPFTRPTIALDAAAAALGLGPEDAEEVLESLVDAALLESPQPGRYRYHELLRNYAEQRLLPHERPPVAARLLRFLLAGAVAAFQRAVPGDPVGTTFTVAGAARFADLAGARAWVVREFDGIAHAVGAAVRSAPDPALLDVAADLLVACSAFGRDISSTLLGSVAHEAAEAAESLGHHRAAGRARFVCGNVAVQATRLDEAREHTTRAADSCRRAEDTVILRQTCNDLGVIALFQQRNADAVRNFDQALALARLLGHRSGALATALNAAVARLRSGAAEEAVAICDEELLALRDVPDSHGAAHALGIRGRALHELGRHDEALATYQECLELCRTAGLPRQEAMARYRRADTLRVTGRPAEALTEARAAVTHLEGARDGERDLAYALQILARTEAGLGDRAAAEEHAARAYASLAALGLPEAADARELLDRLRSEV